MRTILAVLAASVITFVGVAPAAAQTSEREIVNKFLTRKEKASVRKLSWMSVNFAMNRINRENDYNRFATYNSQLFPTTELSWLGQAKSFGLDLGVILKEKFALSIGGEYWLKLGDDKSGSFQYNPPDRPSSTVTNLRSEVKVFGVSAGVQYYFYNHPTLTEKLNKLSLRIGGTVGYYQAKWDLWSQYQNLNLSTATYEDENTTFKGSAPGFSMSLGADYPLRWWDMGLGVEFGYMYLNFKNVAWYNSQDEEIVVTYGDTQSSRVDLALSGFRGKIELKRFFSW